MLIAVLVAACILAAAFVGFSRLSTRPRPERPSKAAGSAPQRLCLLCSSLLGPEEKIKSSLFPGKADRIMHIFGCVHCWPATASVPRICPVCKQELGEKAWVMARYFERQAVVGRSPGRKHVHVLGCTHCRG